MKLERFTVKAHEFRHPIEIQRKTSGVDEDNIPIAGKWKPYIRTRAKILNSKGSEYLQARSVGIEIDKTFLIRARTDKHVTASDRILYKGQYYDICTPPNDIQDGGMYVEINAKLVK